ncbi:PREDICTED: uncharacterized protein LOC106121631 [Papilio xuthus]|uniref:ascorbate ferrireductase (transmembrane) n=1 Tax=Papilio xuthus TaxID=66420 RepID=A0AAJ7EDE6_PAPXU|nr:PREDICTED: uncharacterized protein LOC106121631 [Papilio xuthus]XP_013172804.1 PREDICTED: uncharacterized protein LOC106121631 [Papilio xuthus]
MERANLLDSEVRYEEQSVSEVQSHTTLRLTVRGCLNSAAHMLIGANVFVALWFSFKSTPISAFQLHVGLCVVGYQLLMSHAILSLNEDNTWSSRLPVLYRMRLHVALQIIGSVLAIAGSVIMMMEKSVNFTSVHGKLALAALIFTSVSLINGTISFFSNGRRNTIKIAKMNHVLCGTAAFVISSVCLCFGYYKNSFKKWASHDVAIVMISITCLYTAIVVIRPGKTFIRKFLNVFKIKVC